jgi:hypothetical protein
MWLDPKWSISALQARPLIELLKYKLKDADFAIGCERCYLSAAVVLISAHMLNFDHVQTLFPEEQAKRPQRILIAAGCTRPDVAPVVL